MLAGWTFVAAEIDNYAYDLMLRLSPDYAAESSGAVVLAIDDATYNSMGGVRRYRTMLAQALDYLVAAPPKVVALDVILADRGDPVEDARLASAMQRTHNLVLAADLVKDGWEEPMASFRPFAAAVGHIYADEESRDGVTRQITLEQQAHHQRRWALALEAFRLARGGRLVESPDDLEIAGVSIPAPRRNGARPLRIRYAHDGVPTISLKDFLTKPTLAAQLKDKVVFIGVTSLTDARDRVVTPDGGHIPGVEIHAQVFQTLARGRFLREASNMLVLGFCAAVGIAAAAIFLLLTGWQAYWFAALLLGSAHIAPFLFFGRGIVFPYFAPVAVAWLTVSGAASYQHFIVRRKLLMSEAERNRYQKAIHFVTHEMRSPLTAIQGSSEMLGRYNMDEEKRKQMAGMINMESKRLARMVQTFLDVERLSEGQMELTKETFALGDLAQVCIERARPLAENKNIVIACQPLPESTMQGDRELMEYAFYNLLNNAIKYSPIDTTVSVSGRQTAQQLSLSVSDQGIGMDEKELKSIFKKFYRTKRAEATGEAGTGIGLSIVDQIVTHHGGRIDVTSTPGKGSCFTMVLPAR